MSNKHYAISRLQARGGTWYWQVTLRRRTKQLSKSFTDLKHGGRAAALAKAIAWRDRTAGGATLSMQEFHAKVRTNNRSGVSGVQKYFKRNQPEGWWQARIKLADGRQMTRSFSIKKYGDEDAFRRAVAARRELLRLVDNRPYLNSPAAKRLADVRVNRKG